jgi:hypothetical protein
MVWHKVIERLQGFFGPVFLDESYRYHDGNGNGDTDSIVNAPNQK